MQKAVITSLTTLLVITAFSLQPLYSQEIENISDENTSKYLLDNGLTLIFKEDQRTPTFAASLFIKTGSATEGSYAGSGITHFIEHLIFKGTSTRDAGQIEADIKSLGADMGAYTTFDHTAFKMEGPRDNIIALMDTFYDIIANSKFDKKEFAKEKDVIKREMDFVHDSPQKYLSRKFWQTSYMIHPYRNPVIGYKDIFDKLSAEDLKSYYASSYIPDNMVLVIVGDINQEAVKDKIEETFGKLERESLAQPVVAQEPAQVAPRYIDTPYPISKTYMMIGFHTVSLAGPDLYALDTLALVLGEGRSSLLYKKLHNRLNLVYGISAYNYTPFDPGMFIITAILEPGNKDRVMTEIFKEIDRLKQSPLKKNELDKAKNQVISSYIFSKQTQASQANDLGISQLLTGSMDFSKYYVEGVRSVTSQDIIDVARKYLIRKNMTTALLLPSVIKETESKAKAKPATSRTLIKKNMRNGIRVLLCQDKALPLVSIRISIGGGLRAENRADNGISNLTAQMLTKGTGSRREEELFFLIESLGGSLSSYSANNSFGLSMDIMSRDFKKGIDILGSVLSQPAFPRDKLRLLKKDILAQIDLADDDIFIATQKRLRQKLFLDHPYSMLSIGTKESVEKIRRRDIVNFYRTHCVGPNIVISICGDIEPDKAYRMIASKFRSIRKKHLPQFKDIPLRPIAKRIEIIDKMDKRESVLMAGFRSAGMTNPDRYPLQILSSLFSGGAGRLYANIRQKKGMAYTLGVFGMTGIDTGSFIFYAATKFENIDSVKDDIFKEIESVSEAKITEEEIDSAKRSLIAKHQIGLQAAGAFALKTALDELYGLGFNNYLIYPGIIGRISKEEIIQIANRYLTPGSCVVSITVPEDEKR